jgi:hypothetical protein
MAKRKSGTRSERREAVTNKEEFQNGIPRIELKTGGEMGSDRRENDVELIQNHRGPAASIEMAARPNLL